MVRTAAEGGSLFLTEKPADTCDPIAATRRLTLRFALRRDG